MNIGTGVCILTNVVQHKSAGR